MFSKVTSCAVYGVSGTLIQVEADVNDGLPMFTMVGYLSSSVKEAGERVRTALRNSGYSVPSKRITVNLSPANIRKDGAGFDLPVAIAVLLASFVTPVINLNDYVIMGELSLDGTIKPIKGVLPMVSYCHDCGIKNCIVPIDNAKEAALVKGMQVYGAGTLSEVMSFIQGNDVISKVEGSHESFGRMADNINDFADIKGQESLKRGLEIAASGFHNVLMTGAAGAGKSMLARCIPGIMPSLSFEECLEITKIYSVSGMLYNEGSLIENRPFRAPHHTISEHALIGGGAIPRPGEVSLAHNGVLFLDELPEFSKGVLEVLRQPIEDRCVTISRVHATYVYPSDFMMVAAMNPCPCGHYPDLRKCSCTPLQIKRYQSRISGPLMDRIDINMEVKPVPYDELFSKSRAESSNQIRERVERARCIQEKRYRDESIHFNSQLDGRLIKKYISLDDSKEELLSKTFKDNELSARGVHRVIKLARTIADMDGKRDIEDIHIMEAVFYRNGGVNVYDR